MHKWGKQWDGSCKERLLHCLRTNKIQTAGTQKYLEQDILDLIRDIELTIVLMRFDRNITDIYIKGYTIETFETVDSNQNTIPMKTPDSRQKHGWIQNSTNIKIFITNLVSARR